MLRFVTRSQKKYTLKLHFTRAIDSRTQSTLLTLDSPSQTLVHVASQQTRLIGPHTRHRFPTPTRSPTATRLARVWAPPTPICWSRSEFSDILWAELIVGVGVGVVYGQKRPNFLKLLINHRFEIEIRTTSFYFTDNRYFTSVLT